MGAATLVVTGASMIPFASFIHAAAFHIGFPIASSFAALHLFDHASRRNVAAVAAVRSVFVLLFQWTVADIVYRLVMEVLTPLLLVTAAVGAVYAWRRFRPKSRADKQD